MFSYAYAYYRGYIFIIADVVYKVYFQRKVFGGQIILDISLFAYDCGPFSGTEGGYIQLWRTTVIAMKQAKKMVQVDVRDRDKHWIQLLFIIGSSSPGAVFFSYWIWARGQRLVEWG